MNLPSIKDCPNFLATIVRTSGPTIVGLGKADQLTVAELHSLDLDHKMKHYAMLLVNGISYYIKAWKETKRHNSTVCFDFNGSATHGRINYFVGAPGTDTFFAVVQIFMCTPCKKCDDLFITELTPNTVTIKVASIIHKCIYMEVESSSYISKIVDPFERD